MTTVSSENTISGKMALLSLSYKCVTVPQQYLEQQDHLFGHLVTQYLLVHSHAEIIYLAKPHSLNKLQMAAIQTQFMNSLHRNWIKL
jgi:hypothetical protein